MQMCPECGNYYDESEYAKCPNCHPVSGNPNDDVIVWDNEEEKLKVVKRSELQQQLISHNWRNTGKRREGLLRSSNESTSETEG